VRSNALYFLAFGDKFVVEWNYTRRSCLLPIYLDNRRADERYLNDNLRSKGQEKKNFFNEFQLVAYGQTSVDNIMNMNGSTEYNRKIENAPFIQETTHFNVFFFKDWIKIDLRKLVADLERFKDGN